MISRSSVRDRFQVTNGIRSEDAHGVAGFKLVWTAVTFSDIREFRSIATISMSLFLTLTCTQTSVEASCVGTATTACDRARRAAARRHWQLRTDTFF